MKKSKLAVLAAALLLTTTGTQAEIFVSANDGKQFRPDDTVHPEPDTVSVIDVTDGRVRLLGSVAAPVALTGPPNLVAVTGDSRLAIVTSSQKLNGKTLVPDNRVSLIDISVPSNPRLLQTVEAGPGASGVDISPDGRLVLVASTGDDSITLFSLAGRQLTRVGQVVLEKGSGATDVMFLKDGKSAVAVGRMNFRMMLLSVSPSGVIDTGKSFDSGRAPYGGTITPDGKYLLNTNLQGAWPEGTSSRNPPPPPPPGGRGRGGGGGGATIALVNLASGQVAAQAVTAGSVPEHVMLSADGRIAAVILANGSGNLIRSSPNFATTTGILEVFAVGDGTLTKLAQAPIGHWPQGGAITRDGKTILVQNGYEREIAVYRLEGNTLRQDIAATIKMGARPGAIASALSR